jgi:site-specific recombinase XerD
MQNNRSTFGLLFYLNTGKTKKSGKCPVMGRISVDGKNTAFGTGLDIFPTDWNAKSGIVTGKSKDCISINKQIENFKTEISTHYKTMLESKGFVTAEMLKNALRGIGTSQNTVMQEFSLFLEDKKKSIGIRIREQSYRLYENGYQCFKMFLKDKLGVADIPFGKLDISLIEDYAYYMKIDKKMTAWSVITFLKPLRSTVKRALNKGLIRQNPFLDYVQEKASYKIKWLSNSEIERLINVEIKRPSANFIRDMFLFSVFTGISFIDLKNLKDSNIKQQDDGNKWIVFNRQKTGTASYIPLLDIPQKILEKYLNSKFAGKDGKVFKIGTLANFNVHLKVIAKAAEIDKALSFHVGRHSFGTSICLTNGVPIESVSKMMGHKSIKTTQIYAKITRTKLNEDMTNLEKRIEGKYKLAENEFKHQ